jgi:hypothetical protein
MLSLSFVVTSAPSATSRRMSRADAALATMPTTPASNTIVLLLLAVADNCNAVLREGRSVVSDSMGGDRNRLNAVVDKHPLTVVVELAGCAMGTRVDWLAPDETEIARWTAAVPTRRGRGAKYGGQLVLTSRHLVWQPGASDLSGARRTRSPATTRPAGSRQQSAPLEHGSDRAMPEYTPLASG